MIRGRNSIQIYLSFAAANILSLEQDNRVISTLKDLLYVVLAKNNIASKSDVSKLQYGKVFLLSENDLTSNIMFISNGSQVYK
jgi:hypothetical protein